MLPYKGSNSVLDEKLSLIGRELYNLKSDYKNLTPETIKDYVKKVKSLTSATYHHIAKLKGNLKFNDIFIPLINLDLITAKAENICYFMNSVHPKKEIRDESLKAEQELSKFFIDLSLREDIYKVFKSYYENNYKDEKKSLTHEENRLVEKTINGYKRSGLDIKDETKKHRIKSIKKKLTELSSKYSSNLNEDNTVFFMPKEKLAGMPESWFKNKKIDGDDGLYKITLKYPDYFPAMKYIKSSEVRGKLYKAFTSKAKNYNLKIMTEAVQLRQELAELLGYKNYADYVNQIKMSKQGAAVGKFIDEMAKRFKDIQQQEVKDLTVFAQKVLNDKNYKLQIYDVAYFSRLKKEKEFNIDMNEVKKYFPLDKLIQGTFDIYEKLLGLKFVATKNQDIWHDDVKTYDVYNYNHNSEKLGNKIGSFYLDLHPREGKYGHAAVSPMIPGCDLSKFLGQKGKRQLPKGTMMCNFPKDECIPFNQVVTFFHEFGHLMHGMCSKTQLPNFHGTRVERDFVEAPSQMLERWCTSEKALKILSFHIDTGKPLPKELAEKLKAMDNFHVGIHSMRQLTFSKYDYTIHTMGKDKLKNLDINKVYQNIQNEFTGFPKVKGEHFPGTFGHLMGGYAAGYYGYMWSNAFAADMFYTKFAKDPLNQKAGLEYRKHILQPGGSIDAVDMLKNFLGRKPSIEAYLIEKGLKNKKDVNSKPKNKFN